MFCEYAKVTSVETDPAAGGQLITATGQVSTKNYIKIELMSFRGSIGIPRQGDYVLVLTVSTNQYLCLGVVEQADLELNEGEVLLHSQTVKEVGQSKEYIQRTEIKVNEDHEIVLRTITEDEEEVTKVHLKQNGGVEVDTKENIYARSREGDVTLVGDTGKMTIQATAGNLEINAPAGEVTVNATKVNLP